MPVEPTKYYKYRPLYTYLANGEREAHKFTQAIFETKKLWFDAPAKFNDPFDCNLRLHTDEATDEEWIAYFDDLKSVSPSNASNLDQAKREKWWDTQPDFKETIGRNQHRNHYEESSVFCLSKKGNSIPMFSYYADEHRGICIEFEFSDKDVICGIPYEEKNEHGVPFGGKVAFRDVEYPKEYPELNFLRIRNSDKLLRGLLFTKHHEWTHEEEFRIFRRNVPASLAEYRPKLLTRIIFGCKTDASDVDLVKVWVKDWPSPIVLAKATPQNRAFELNIEDFERVEPSSIR